MRAGTRWNDFVYRQEAGFGRNASPGADAEDRRINGGSREIAREPAASKSVKRLANTSADQKTSQGGSDADRSDNHSGEPEYFFVGQKSQRADHQRDFQNAFASVEIVRALAHQIPF